MLVEFLFIAIYHIAILELIRLFHIVLYTFLIKCGIIILKMQVDDEAFCGNWTNASQVTISDFDYILSICWEA